MKVYFEKTDGDNNVIITNGGGRQRYIMAHQTALMKA